jgi:Uma2 family endonuclease
MPSAFLEAVAPPPLESLYRKKWTVCEIEELLSKGWHPGDGYELIDGELIDKKVGKNYPHILATMWLHQWLIGVFGFWRVLKDDPVNVDENNEPEPDLVVLRAPLQELGRKPQPEDVLLVVEVAASSLAMDRSIKADLYARTGIADYWVLDVNHRRMIVHREPKDGKYASVVAYGEEESISPLAAPESAFRVAVAFGK